MSKIRIIVLSITEQGLSKAEVAKKFSVSRRWINLLLKRYEEGGIAALEPRSKRPKTNSRSIPPDLSEQIKQMRYWLEDQGFDAGPLSIHWHLKRFGTTPPSTATIRRVLVKANMITPEPRKRPRNSYLRFQADQPNETWQSDFTHWRLDNNTDVEILNILDDHSRLLLACKAYKPVTVNSVISLFEQAFRDYGPPQSTLTDNGAVFTAKYRGGKNKFEYLLDDLGIIQKNGSPNHPQTQGKIERFHQTLKAWLKRRPRATSIAVLQQQLDEFREIYNRHRPHSSLNNSTPHEIYFATLKAAPGSHSSAGTYRIRHDRVDDAGKVTLRRAGTLHKLGVGRAHARASVLMLIHSDSVTITEKGTAVIIAEFDIDPNKKYWPKRKTQARKI